MGPYELLAPLGAGGMAETFVAVRRGLGGFEQRVCLKRILPGRARDARFVELFMDEARLLARMRWAGIVQVYDFGEADGTYYMALELVEGIDLDELLRVEQSAGTRVPAEVTMYVAASLLSSLAYAHDLVIDGQPLHIIHRDISPSNVLLSAHGEVKLTDFGIAKAFGRTHKTQTGYTKGKPAFMSPEQVRGEPLDRRTDLFSTGIVLYQLLSGEHPFDAATDLALFNNILSGIRRPLTEFDPTLPPELVALVDALLEVDPARRPQTAGDALAYISRSVQFITGQRLLAQRVKHCADFKLSSRAPTLAATPAPTSMPPTTRDGFTKLLAPSGSLPDARAHAAKNTTGRPLHAAAEARSRKALGFAMGALIGAGILGVIVLRNPDLAREMSERSGATTPAEPRVDHKAPLATQPLTTVETTPPAALPIQDAGAMALPRARDAATSAERPVQLAAPTDAGHRAEAGHPPRSRAARQAARETGDAGAREKPWIEVTRDEF